MIIARRLFAFACAVVAVHAAWNNVAAEELRRWSVTGRGAHIVVSDCAECGDDVGLTIACKADGRTAEITVLWAAQKEGAEGAVAPVLFMFGTKEFSYSAKTLRMEAIGFPPSLSVPVNDPLLDALQAERQVSVRFGDAAANFSLAGAKDAIEQFKSNCARATTDAEPGSIANPTPVRDATALSDGAVWSVSQRGQELIAAFGVPETDATSVAITCRANRAPPTLEFFAAPNFDQGAKAEVVLLGAAQPLAILARANRNRRLEVALDANAGAARRMIAAAAPVTITVNHAPAGRFLGLSASNEGKKFIDSCAGFTD